MEPENEAISAAPGKVLVVDDEPENAQLLRQVVEVLGHEVEEAGDGESALRLVQRWMPDVVLLDVMMPRMDGFEVCRRLRADRKTAHLRIIMITALTERKDRLSGISSGANDFLSKPIDTTEVMLRVQNAMISAQLFNEVSSNLRRINQLEELRSNLSNMIVHDLRSPLMGITANLELALDDAEAPLPKEARPCIVGAMRAAESLVEMVSSLLDVSRLEEGKMPLELVARDVASVARDGLDSLGTLPRGTPVVVETPAGPVRAKCDFSVVRRIVANLVGNADKFAMAGTDIRVVIEPFEGGARVQVIDRGPGIPAEMHEKIFEKFGQAEQYSSGRKYSTGLGLTFCRLAVEAHGGKIGLVSEPGRGSTFWFTLPAA